MHINVKAVKSIILEYLRKFPEEEKDSLSFDLAESSLKVSISGDLSSLRIINVIVNVLLKHVKLGETSRFFTFDLSLSIEEAIMNVFIHSYPGGKGKVEIEISFDDEKATVRIVDFGLGGRDLDLESRLSAEPVEKFSPSGRGILLIKKAVNELRYHTLKDKNVLQLTKLYREK